MSKIPQLVKTKIYTKASERSNAFEKLAFGSGGEYGYQLALSELEAKDYQINELIRTTGNAQDRLIGEIDKRDKEIAFLKSQLETLEDDLKNAHPF